MGVVDTVVSSVRNTELEERASVALMPYARNLAKKYSGHNRWMLDKNELFGELCLEIAKAIQSYLYVIPYGEFLKAARTMLYYRYQEILGKSTGKYYGREFSAHVLKEDMSFGSNIDNGYSYSDFSIDFMKGLSDLAKSMTNLALNPSDEMIVQLNEYVKSRNSKYVHGAGVRKIPLRIFAAVTGESIFNIRAANNEIRRKLREIDDMTDTDLRIKGADEDTGEYLMSFDYANGQVTSFMTGERYIEWGREAIFQQADHRKLERNGLRRGEVASLLHQDDIAKGVSTQDDIVSGVSPAETVVAVMSKSDIDDGQDDGFDTKFLKKNGNGKDEEKVDESHEVAEFFGDKPPDDDDEEEVEVDEPVVVPATTKVALTKTIQTKENPFQAIMESMPVGVSMTVTRLGENEWHVEIVESEEQVATKIPVDNHEPTVKLKKAEDGKVVPVVDDKLESGTDEVVKLKKTTQAWRDLVLSPKYVTWMDEMKELSIEELKKIAKELNAVWEKQSHPPAERRNVLQAIRKAKKIYKYKPAYRTREGRAAVTL